MIKKVKKCPDETAGSDAFRGLSEFARRFVAVCPLVAAFKRPAFEPRHWKELLFIAVPDDNPPEYRR